MRRFLVRTGLILALPYVITIAFITGLVRTRSLYWAVANVRADCADFWDLWENLHDA